MLASLNKHLRGVEKAKLEILAWLEKNKLKPNDRFLSQRQLAELLDIDPMTAHKVLTDLSKKGILYRKKGSGTFIGPDASKNTTFKYAVILPGVNMETPESNPECWHLVQTMMLSFTQSIKENEIFSTIVLNPDYDVSAAELKVADFDVIFFSSDLQYRALISHLNALGKKQMVIIGSSPDCDIKCIKLASSAKINTYKAISYLLDNGYRRIGYLGAGFLKEKLEGYKQALSDYGINFSEKDIVLGLDTQNDGPRGASVLMERGFDGNCIFVDTDLKAIGVIDYLTKREIRVPEDISIMGYDGMEQFSKAPPYLTSFKNSTKELIREALNLLRVRQKGEYIDKTIEIPGTVIVNKTVKTERG